METGKVKELSDAVTGDYVSIDKYQMLIFVSVY